MRRTKEKIIVKNIHFAIVSLWPVGKPQEIFNF